MTNEQYQEMKDSYIEYIKEFMQEYGQFGPMITVFADSHLDNEKPAIIHIPIPPDFMKNDESKEEFVSEVVPDIFSNIKENFTPFAVAWAAEAWVRKAEKEEDISNSNNISSRKEVMFVTIQTKDDTTCTVFNIKRNGKQVTSTGDLVDNVELEEDKDLLNGAESVAGRFSNLFSKFDD